MELAAGYLKMAGYSVRDTSASFPFDFEAVKGADTIKIEVKGTTSLAAEAILMTRNEIALHQTECGFTGLIVVSGIVLSGPDRTEASGGTLVKWIPWIIEKCSLSPIAYEVTLEGE